MVREMRVGKVEAGRERKRFLLCPRLLLAWSGQGLGRVSRQGFCSASQETFRKRKLSREAKLCLPCAPCGCRAELHRIENTLKYAAC